MSPEGKLLAGMKITTAHWMHSQVPAQRQFSAKIECHSQRCQSQRFCAFDQRLFYEAVVSVRNALKPRNRSSSNPTVPESTAKVLFNWQCTTWVLRVLVSETRKASPVLAGSNWSWSPGGGRTALLEMGTEDHVWHLGDPLGCLWFSFPSVIWMRPWRGK